MVTIDKTHPLPFVPATDAVKAPSQPVRTGARIPMGPVDAAQMGARADTNQPGTMWRFFSKSPSVRAVLLGTTMLTSGLVAGPTMAQVVEPVTAPQTELVVPSGLQSRALQAPALGPVAAGFDILALGQSGEATTAVQRALEMIGIPLRGGVDGDFGYGTAQAIEAFRARAGLPAAVWVDAAMLRALDAEVTIAESIATPRFRSTPAFLQIALGNATLERGTTDEKSTEILQASLYSLGYDLGSHYVDADFGNATEQALMAFQARANLPATGKLDAQTLTALDAAASAQLATLRAAEIEPGTKNDKFRIVLDLVANRIYVVDKASGEPTARYLTSPGKRGYETKGDQFTVGQTMVRRTWYPTPSMNARPIGPGLDNPMGVVKFNLGRYYQYIHGTPFSVRDRLGEPASRGCLRMSSENILDIADYMEPGTDVQVTRDRAESRRLEAAATRAGVGDEPLDSGRERFAAYLTGELGQDEVLEGGRVVRK